MEDGKPDVDLVLGVGAILGKATVKDHGQQEVALAGLGRDRDQAAITDERSYDPLPLGQAAWPRYTWPRHVSWVATLNHRPGT